MKTIRVVIGRSTDNYGAYAEDVPGIWGGGNSVAEARQSILDAIQLIKEYNKDENIPAVLKEEYQIVWKMDVESLIAYYKGIFTSAALERITGINQRQLSHYATGLKKPRPNQRKKIEEALHSLGSELLALEL
ncbi:type II toxin-antitoxin system HicB family antitoxin [Dyadobacter bucti]|uniref:type II toxin-antitoxin system HicB family antitoxin n=1 Tax=Dyadobacter bucti TaxID=2572203 RepID=UPI0011095BCE|nr:type II toxin-antitoxin system HicB family antitoxin [Dyadobacter bucti]